MHFLEEIKVSKKHSLLQGNAVATCSDMSNSHNTNFKEWFCTIRVAQVSKYQDPKDHLSEDLLATHSCVCSCCNLDPTGLWDTSSLEIPRCEPHDVSATRPWRGPTLDVLYKVKNEDLKAGSSSIVIQRRLTIIVQKLAMFFISPVSKPLSLPHLVTNETAGISPP